jgi:hypothetical protein
MYRGSKVFRGFVSSVINGIGTLLDPGSAFELSTEIENYSEAEIISAYTKSGQLRRAINLVPDTAAKFIYINTDNQQINLPPTLEEKIKQLELREKFCLASISARLFKESYLMIITDNDNYSEPIDESETILELLPLEIGQLNFLLDNNGFKRNYRLMVFDNQSVSGEFGNPATNQSDYSLYLGNNNTAQIDIHESRILMFCGSHYPLKIRNANYGFNGNIIGGILSSHSSYRHALNISISLLSRMSTFVVKLKKLQEYITSKNAAGLKERLEALKSFIGSIGGFVIDADSEDLTWVQMNLSGIPEIINLHKKQYTADTELTHDQLWNEGTHDTASETEENNFYKRVNSFLSKHWQHNFNIVVKLLDYSGEEIILSMPMLEHKMQQNMLDQQQNSANQQNNSNNGNNNSNSSSSSSSNNNNGGNRSNNNASTRQPQTN